MLLSIGRKCLGISYGITLVVFVMLFVALSVSAQLPTGTILGVVKDSSGAVVPGATVTIQNTDTNQVRTVTSSDDGAFRASGLSTGHYSLKIEKSGFKTETQTGLTLDVGQEIVANLSLQIGTSSQEVTVTEEAPLVNTTSSSTGGLVNEAALADLPLNGRNYVDLALLQAGVMQNPVQSGGGGGIAGTFFSSNGNPIRSNHFSLDGASMDNSMGGSSSSLAGTTLGVDGIKEYTVVTHSFSAEYGEVMGSQVVLVSKGGSNAFHGDGFEYLRNSAMDARNFFDTGYLVAGAPRLPEFQRNNFGASFGGPIRKDKTFFYAVYEGLRQKLGVTITDTVPLASCHNLIAHGDGTYRFDNAADATNCGTGLSTGTVIPGVVVPWLALYPLPTPVLANQTGNYTFPGTSRVGLNFGQMRVDQTLSASDSFFSRYTVDESHLTNTQTNITLVSTVSALPEWSVQAAGRNQFLTVAENHIFSPSLLNQVRLSYSRSPSDIANIVNVGPLDPNGLSGPQYSLISGQTFGGVSISGFTGLGPNTTYPVTHVVNVLTFSDDVYYTKGAHALKFGVLVNRYNVGLTQQFIAGGAVTFTSLSGFFTGIPSTYRANTPYTGLGAIPQPVAGGGFNYDWIYGTEGFYAQDDWRVTPRLTVNLGLRYEILNGLHELNGRMSSIPDMETSNQPVLGPAWRNYTLGDFTPRVGFAWDVTGKGKTSLRGGIGIFDDVGNISDLLMGDQAGNPPFKAQNTVNNPTSVVTVPLTFPAVPIWSLQIVDHNLKQPYSLQENLTLEQQLPFNASISVGYVGNRAIHLLDTSEGNPCKPESIVNGLPIYANNLNANGTASGTTLTCPLGRFNPAWATSIFTDSASNSWYNALQVVLTKKVSHGLQLGSTYTWSKALDTTVGARNSSDCAESVVPMYSPNLLLSKGPSCADVRNSFNINAIYHFPEIKTNNFLGKVEHGWWVGTLAKLQGGYPFTPFLANQRALSGNLNTQADQASLVTTAATGTFTVQGQPQTYNFVPYNANTVETGSPNNWWNPLMFDLGPVGQLGNSSHGMLRGPGLRAWDLSVNKDTALPMLGEQGAVEFRVEMFNILNHANFGPPGTTFYAGATSTPPGPSQAPQGATLANPLGTVGQITTTSTTSRQVQLALKVIF